MRDSRPNDPDDGDDRFYQAELGGLAALMDLGAEDGARPLAHSSRPDGVPVQEGNGRVGPVAIRGYILARELSRGGQAVVYEAVQRSTGRQVAVKVLREGPLASPAERARLEREVRALAAL